MPKNKLTIIFGSSGRLSGSIGKLLSGSSLVVKVGRNPLPMDSDDAHLFICHDLALEPFQPEIHPALAELADDRKIDLIFLASAQAPRGKFWELPETEILNVVNSNFLFTILTLRNFLRSKMAQIDSVLVFGSQAATYGGNEITAYASAKAALELFVVGISRELRTEGIRINAISPSVIETDKILSLGEDKLCELRKGAVNSTLPSADDIAWLVADLLSERFRFLSGAVIPITGGR